MGIEHVYVLMLENRSFDHMLGFSEITGSDAATGQPSAIIGLTGAESNSSNGTSYPVTRGADPIMPTDPSHEFPAVVEQLCGKDVRNQSNMSNFATDSVVNFMRPAAPTPSCQPIRPTNFRPSWSNCAGKTYGIRTAGRILRSITADLWRRTCTAAERTRERS